MGQLAEAVKWTKSGSTWSSIIVGTYAYDANGAMAKSVEGSTTIEYVYQGFSSVLHPLDLRRDGASDIGTDLDPPPVADSRSVKTIGREWRTPSAQP